MKFITLTEKCVNFEFSSQQNPDVLILTWNVAHDFSNVAFIGVNSFHLSNIIQFKDQNHFHDNHIRISTNLISRTITNPTRNILDIRVPKHAIVAECRINTSRLNIYVLLFLKFIFRHVSMLCG